VKPVIFLRIASVLTFIHCVLHTIGGVFGKPRNGAEEILVQETMKAHVFNVMGSMLFWQLATMSKTNAAWTKPIVALFFFNFFIMTFVAWRYFFIAPAVTELLIAACLAAAYLTATAHT
jgi:hypothetical protein